MSSGRRPPLSRFKTKMCALSELCELSPRDVVGSIRKDWDGLRPACGAIWRVSCVTSITRRRHRPALPFGCGQVQTATEPTVSREVSLPLALQQIQRLSLSNLETVMIKRKHIEHAELMQLGKMLLLLTDQEQTTMACSCPTELKKQETLAHEQAAALRGLGSSCQPDSNTFFA
jgi:hypothetical protein